MVKPSLPLKVVFAGTPEFAAQALKALLQAGCTVPLVLTQPDRPAGRGMKLQASPVKGVAQAHGVPVAQPLSLRLDGKHPDDAQAAQEALCGAAPDVMVVAAYGLLLPRWTLQLPRLGCINIHASLLPRWRGAAPIQRAIEAGDARTGITLMQMDEGLDTGAMLEMQALHIGPDDTSASLHERLAALGASMIVPALRQLSEQGLPATPQPEQGISHARKIGKGEGPIDWNEPAEVIERRIRAFDPFPGASLQRGSELIKVWKAAVLPMEGAAAPATVVDIRQGEPVVACGQDALQLKILQRPGGRRLPSADALRSHPLRPGEQLWTPAP